jgi:hypothetical protein
MRELDRDLQPLFDDFFVNADRVRILLLISPT